MPLSMESREPTFSLIFEDVAAVSSDTLAISSVPLVASSEARKACIAFSLVALELPVIVSILDEISCIFSFISPDCLSIVLNEALTSSNSRLLSAKTFAHSCML